MKSVKVNVEALSVCNLALQQNGLFLIQKIEVTNDGDEPLKGLRCDIRCTPGFIDSATFALPELSAGASHQLAKPHIDMRYDILLGLSEAVNGTLTFEFSCGNEQGGHPEVLCSTRKPLTAFAYDQWLGSAVFPELLCSFVTPNLDLVCQLQSNVADELKKATDDSAVCGYQQGRERAYEICKAAYRALASWQLQYAEPLASFDTPGQRIRLADKIYTFHLATCLDSSLLFASLLEQCGLNPVLMLHKGHAYVGCHLVDRHFPEMPMNDLQQIRKLCDMDEFTVVETTLLADSKATFTEAEDYARKNHLNEDDSFEFAIDVKRARSSGIRPLPLVRSPEGIRIDPVEHKPEKLAAEGTRKLEEQVALDELQDSATLPPRVKRWTQRLLDLSLRNPLLNARDSRQGIPLLCTDIGMLENHIADNRRISLLPLERLIGDKDLQTLAESQNGNIALAIKDVLEKELAAFRLWSSLKDKELQSRLKYLYRTGRVDLEEGGVNTIFLAIGMVEWRERESEPKGHMAPILLVPVKIERASVADGYKIIRLDEDTLVNETLLEMLRSQFHLEIPGVHPLPTDESGVDVPKVIQIFRASLRELRGWEVREEARLGHFSFGKFVMWTDMTMRLEALEANPLVSHLIAGGGLYDDGVEVFPPSEIASHLQLDHLFCPMSADSSQLTAVLYSELGKTFVLHGPPGTGKSQTITNIIAHNLALGRRVLFVSEKKAALDVVHNRLSKIGLRPFCLELHSSKAGKGAVLAQFSEVLKVPDTSEGREWEDVAQDLTALRSQLNEYVSALHHVYSCGLSVYDCFSVFLTDRTPTPHKQLNIDILSWTSEQLKAAREAVSVLSSRWLMTTPEAVASMGPLTVQPWNPLLERNLKAQAAELALAVAALKKDAEALAEKLAWDGASSIKSIAEMLQVQAQLENVPALPLELMTPEFVAEAEAVKRFLDDAMRIAELEHGLGDFDLDRVTKVNWAGVEQRLSEANAAFFIMRFFKVRGIVKELSAIKRPGGTPLNAKELALKLPQLREYADLWIAQQKVLERMSGLLGSAWKGNDGAKHTSELVQSALAFMSEWHGKSGFDALREAMARPVEERRGLIDVYKSVRNSYEKVGRCMEEMAPNADGLEQVTSLDMLIAFAEAVSAPDADIRGVLQYRLAEKVAQEASCGVMCDFLRENLCPPQELERMFDRLFRMEFIDAVVSQSPVLSQFTGMEREERIRRFRELDDRFLKLSQQEVVAKLSARLPRKRAEKGPENTELGRLQRECEKKARQKPVRQLLEQIQTLLPVLKPCFLMSPMSVAQYLPANSAPFDMVVFDEASQIPVWDAIGVIARARQLIVVGDPKQMPPTNFFQKGDAGADDVDDANEEDIPDDMESILDECLAAGVHSSYLNWHYRSRHESLIAFSNHYYYDDKLFTFPAAKRPPTNGVRFMFVPDGVYAFGAGRTNRREAEALVDYVVKRLKETGGKRSVGIVTFSEAQRDLIEDLLDARREKEPSIEPAFADTNPEPLFVKNLENVQGDERDVILFSICYARDENGRLSLNFGPLNRQGGERRLNVAVTRAKEQVVVFSSIHGSDINLDRTKSVGPAHLRQFLEFAEKGIEVQGKRLSSESEGLATAVEKVLEENGYKTVRNVGCSGCRIDVAVRHPNKPDEFILGIECDGPGYASMQTVRDRDHLLDSVLERLGWHLWRVWTVDWAYDMPHAKAALLAELDRLVKLPDEADSDSASSQAEQNKGGENSQAVAKEAAGSIENGQKTNALNASQEEWYAGKANRQEDPLSGGANCQKNVYRAWKPKRAYNADQWNSDKMLSGAMQELLAAEWPVCETVFRKKLLAAFAIPRMSDAVSQRIAACMPRNIVWTPMVGDNVLWPSDQSPDAYDAYRVPDQDTAERRAIDEIPPQEIANAMREVQLDYGTDDVETLCREALRIFGMTVLTAKARKYLEAAYQMMKERETSSN